MSPRIEDLTLGQIVAEWQLPLSRDSLVRYAGASGDFNPIHYRDDVAGEVGLPGVLAHGMLTMGAAGQVAVEWAGGAHRVRDFQVRFTRPVVVDPASGAVLDVSVKVGGIDTEAKTVRLDLTVRFDGNTVLGKAQLLAATD